MQETLKYEKPSIKFVSLRANKNVADPCWSPKEYNSKELYYDVPGKGYIRFKAGDNGDNCGQAEISILEYYNIPQNNRPTEEQLKSMVSAACGGGNSGNPYKNTDGTVAPAPDPSWS